MREILYTCNRCEKHIKTEREGGRRPDFVPAIAYFPPEHYVVTNNRGEIFDYCSKDCIELGDF